MIQKHGVSHRQTCKAVHVSSSTNRYKPVQGKDDLIVSELLSLVESHPAIGFWQCFTGCAERALGGITSAYTGFILPLSSISVAEGKSTFQPGSNKLYSSQNNPILSGASTSWPTVYGMGEPFDC